ncbi:hypothetical protein [Algoriphagus sp.]|uniref:hypothetical protein n=1 Tax=Algoriphagus sp. TaxID=1872435 RepID=UPI00391DFB10
MKFFFKAFFFLPILSVSWIGVFAQENPPIAKNDSIILAQAYINLTLTKEYFEGLSEERISKILQFETNELASIEDKSFLKDNAALYNFSYALLYYNQAKFQFRTISKIEREELIEWKNSLEKAMIHFNLSESKAYWDQPNEFFELIKFEEESFAKLHKELFDLKSLFTPYFNENIYPEFKRIFLKAKNLDKYEIDSLAYLAAIFNIEYKNSIANMEYDVDNYNYGPNILTLKSEYDYTERDYDYNPISKPIETAFLLDQKLDLISRFVQLKYLASESYSDSLSWFESYRLYNDFFLFKDDSQDKLFINKITKELDSFLKTELDQKELDNLHQAFRHKFSYSPYSTAQAFINLSLVQSNFDALSTSQITSILASHESELNEVKDELFIAQNSALYNFTYSLLYENTARLLFRSRQNISRKILVEWKETLEQGIEYFNVSQDKREETNDQKLFHQLIKFQEEDVKSLSKKINGLKDQVTPFFNEDIYPDFQRIYYKAKNTGEYDFDGLKGFAGIFNLGIDFTILENKRGFYKYFSGIGKEYQLQNKLDLVSKYLQFKFLASEKIIIPRGFDVDLLYSTYNEFLNKLDLEEDEFIMRELTPEAIESLFEELQKKFPYSFEREPPEGIYGIPRDQDGDGVVDFLDTEQLFFFPELAPKASASFIKRNFKPELKTLGSVNEFLRREFISAGYKDQLNYYYASDGFAITTSLERFNLNGSAVPSDSRFVKSLTEVRKFSYYEIFKSMFFDLEYNYRMFAMVIASNATKESKDGMTPGFATQIIANSYDALPEVLTNRELPNKTLSVFVYHFRLNVNNGTVELDLTRKITAQDYLKNAGLLRIIQ